MYNISAFFQNNNKTKSELKHTRVPMITKEQLEETLALIFPSSQPKNTQKKVKAIYRSTGPAYLDDWLCQMENNKNCWRTREGALCEAPNKKIIFSHTLINDRAPLSFELDVIRALIQHYEVYPWCGRHIRFLETKPYYDTHDFWENRYDLASATKQQVATTLAEQGISVENYMILDYIHFQTLAYELYKKGSIEIKEGIDIGKEHKNLDAFNPKKIYAPYTSLKTTENLNNLYQSVDPTTNISHISLFEISEPVFDQLNKECVDLLEVRSEKADFFEKENVSLIEKTNQYKYEINNSHLIIKNTTIEDIKHFEDISNRVHYGKHKKDNVEKITIKNCLFGKNLKIGSIYPNIKELTLIDSQNISKILFQFIENLNAIKIINHTHPESFEKSYSHDIEGDEKTIQLPSSLKNFHLQSNHQISKIFFSSESSIENINISNENNLTTIQLPNKVDELQISGCSNFHCFIDHGNCSIKKINLVNAPIVKKFSYSNNALESLKLENNSIKNIDLKNCISLKELSIKTVDSSINSLLNITNAPSLEKITLENCFPLLRYINQSGVTDLTISKKTYSFIEEMNEETEFDLSEYPNIEILRIENDKTKIIELKNAHLLKQLFISCPHLENFSFDKLTSLESLTIKNSKINKIDLTNLNFLNKINLKYCYGLNELKLPPSLKSISIDAEELDIADLKLFSQLKKLKINTYSHKDSFILPEENNIESLSLPSYRLSINDLKKYKFNHLKYLNFKYLNFNHDDLDKKRIIKNDFDFLPSLEYLEISDSHLIDFNLQNNNQLKYLKVYGTKSLTSVFFSNLTSLKNFILECGTIESLEKLAIHHCPNLENFSFHFRKRHSIKEISFSYLDKLPSLYLQSTEENFSLKNVEISQCKEFKKIHLEKCNALNHIQLNELPFLEEVIIESCDNLKYFSITGKNNIRRISIKKCSLKKIDLTQFPFLEELEIDTPGSDSINEINLSRCNQLRILTLKNHPSLENLNLEKCTSLEKITIESCGSINQINLENLRQLKQLSLQHLSPLVIINAAGLDRLADVNINNDSLELSLNGCTNLKILSLRAKENILLHQIEDCIHLGKVKLNFPNRHEVIANLPASCRIYFDKESLPAPSNHSFFDHVVNLFKNNASSQKAYPANINPTNVQIHLHQKNESSSVSLCSSLKLNRDISPDSKTEQNTQPHLATGNLIYNIHPPEEKSHYRFAIHDQIHYQKNNLFFSSTLNDSFLTETIVNQTSFTNEQILNLKRHINNKPDHALGYFEGILEPNQFYPLTAHQPFEEGTISLFFNPANVVIVYWSDQFRQYYIRLAPKQLAQQVEVLYFFKKNPSYQIQHSQHPVTLPKEALLPRECILIIEKLKHSYSNTTHPLAFLFDESQTINNRLDQLKAYCKQFQNAKLDEKSNDPLKILIATALEQKGSCRHRSQTYMMLAHYLGVPVRMIVNEKHAFCETPYFNEDKKQIWVMDELGGSFVLDITQSEKRKNIFDEVKKQSHQSNTSLNTNQHNQNAIQPVFQKNTSKNNENQTEEIMYQKEFEKLVKPNTFHSLEECLKKESPLPPLLLLNKNIHPHNINAALIQSYKKLNSSNKPPYYLYIDKPEDLVLFLYPYCIENGTRKQIKGPLYTLIKEGGILVVNWSNFSTTEKASYKSLLDKDPTLLSESLHDNFVVGLSDDQIETCPAFLSRCEPYLIESIPPQVITEPLPQPKNNQQDIKVDLYHSLNWRSQLLGKIQYEGDRIHLMEGPLMQAIRNHQRLTICNPPLEDADFQLLMHRLIHEKQFVYNGSLIQVPEETVITYDEINHPTMIPQVNIMESTDLLNKNLIYIGLHNFHELYEQLHVNDKKQAIKMAGYLSRFNSEKDAFYLTESIPLFDWKELLANIQLFYSEKIVHFVLAPGVSIEQVATSHLTTHPFPSKITTSNDPDYHAKELYKEKIKSHKKVFIIDVSPHSTFTDLFADIRHEKQTNSDSFTFIYQRKQALEALIHGDTIILNGELSPTLYQQLFSILHGNSPYLQLNGERISIKGEVNAVMPHQAYQNLSLNHAIQKNYQIEDYRHHFSAEDQALLDTIKLFHDYRLRIPPQGPGRPEHEPLLFCTIQSFVHQLKKESKFHPHNPIKGLVNYTYLKNSSDYAYLNVIGKYLFRPRLPATINKRKLSNLINRFSLSLNDENTCKKYGWHFLNCFSGEALVNIIGHDLKLLLDSSLSYPTLSPVVWKRLYSTICNNMPYSIEEKNSSYLKREEQLTSLIEQKNNTIILLKGDPGTGKTHTVKSLKEKMGYEVYEGEEGLLKWLNTQPSQPIIWLVDEWNMLSPGTNDFIKAWMRNERHLYFKGTWYQLTPYHKVIATGNPENFPFRYYDSTLQHYSEVIYFNMPSEAFITEHILKNPLKRANLFEEHLLKSIFDIFSMIKKHNPTYYYSNRDLANLAERIVALTKNNSHEPMLILYQAALAEFAWSIPTPKQRHQFISKLQEYFDVSPVFSHSTIRITPTCAIPSEKADLVDSLKQDLLLRQHAIDEYHTHQRSIHYKRGVLLEGDAGIGKSYLLKSILESQYFEKNHPDPRKRYIEISVSDDKLVEDILIEAFNNGSIVLLDELNLSKKLQRLIHNLLSGTDLNGRQPDHPGFMIFSSQNPAYFKGRESISPDLYNLLNVRYMDNYSDKALLEILANNNLSDKWVPAYHACQKKYPHTTNLRTFYSVTNQFSKRQTAAEKHDIEDNAERRGSTNYFKKN